MFDVSDGVPDMDIKLHKGTVSVYFGDDKGVDTDKKQFAYAVDMTAGQFFRLD